MYPSGFCFLFTIVVRARPCNCPAEVLHWLQGSCSCAVLVDVPRARRPVPERTRALRRRFRSSPAGAMQRLIVCCVLCAFAAANEVCVDKKTGALTSSAARRRRLQSCVRVIVDSLLSGSFIVTETTSLSKGSRCYAVDDIPVVEPHFLHPVRLWRYLTGARPASLCLWCWCVTRRIPP